MGKCRKGRPLFSEDVHIKRFERRYVCKLCKINFIHLHVLSVELTLRDVINLVSGEGGTSIGFTRFVVFPIPGFVAKWLNPHCSENYVNLLYDQNTDSTNSLLFAFIGHFCFNLRLLFFYFPQNRIKIVTSRKTYRNYLRPCIQFRVIKLQVATNFMSNQNEISFY